MIRVIKLTACDYKSFNQKRVGDTDRSLYLFLINQRNQSLLHNLKLPRLFAKGIPRGKSGSSNANNTKGFSPITGFFTILLSWWSI